MNQNPPKNINDSNESNESNETTHSTKNTNLSSFYEDIYKNYLNTMNREYYKNKKHDKSSLDECNNVFDKNKKLLPTPKKDIIYKPPTSTTSTNNSVKNNHINHDLFKLPTLQNKIRPNIDLYKRRPNTPPVIHRKKDLIPSSVITSKTNNDQNGDKNNTQNNNKEKPIEMRIQELLDKIKKTRNSLDDLDKTKNNSSNNDSVTNNPPTTTTTDQPPIHKPYISRSSVVSKYIENNNEFDKYYKSPYFSGLYSKPSSSSKTDDYYNPNNSLFEQPPRNRYLDDIYKTPSPNTPLQSPPIIKKKVNIQVEINGLKDLLKLIEDYPIEYDIEYNINMQALHNIKEPLEELDSMIGMNHLKDSIIDQVIYFVQDLHISKKEKDGDFMHTCIYGPPGTGKTEVAKIMGRIYSKLGILKKNVFKKVTRADLIAGYLGQTAMKTRDMVKECLGGVMFIDEAYALGNSEKRDSFAKECIDTLCEALSDHKHDLMVIIAGYEKELKQCFFSYNDGLESRFTWRFKTDDYKPSELRSIFAKQVREAGWTIEKGHIEDKWFEENMDYFKYYGRDMETLFSKVKIAHSRRVFCLDDSQKKVLQNKDLERGFKQYLENDNVKARKEDKEMRKRIFQSMYS